MIPTIKAQKNLLALWAIGALCLFILIIIRSAGGIYGSKVDEAWAWFLPAIMPTFLLMVTVAIIDFTQQTATAKQSDKFLFRLAFGISLFYLLLVTFTLLNPIATNDSPIIVMKQSSLWLGPMQGLVSAILGAFFIKSK